MKEQEHKDQVALVRALRKMGMPYDLIFAIPNGGKRHLRVATKLKAEGVTAGIPDLFLPHSNGAYFGLFVEMKAGKNKATENQKKKMEELSKQGYLCVVCYGSKEALDIIINYVESGQ